MPGFGPCPYSRTYNDYLCYVKVHACLGDIRATREDRRILSSGVHVIVATPECVFDMLRRQQLRPDHIKMFVLDGLDEMLSRGFKDKVNSSFLCSVFFFNSFLLLIPFLGKHCCTLPLLVFSSQSEVALDQFFNSAISCHMRWCAYGWPGLLINRAIITVVLLHTHRNK